MTQVKNMLIAAFAALLASFAIVSVAYADGYQYEVAVSGGEGATYAGENTYSFIVDYGDTVVLDIDQVALPEGSAYYVKGFRQAGHDDMLAAPAFPVEESVQYVVALGVKGDQVPYTIQYQDAEGNELAAPSTYYGNVGDKPVVAYRYIEGYQPDAYNRTFTLKELGEDNVYTFIYTPLPEGATANPAAVISDTVAAVAEGTVAPEEAAEVLAAAVTEIADDPNALAQPEQVIDEDENPLANFEGNDNSLQAMLTGPLALGLYALAAALIILLTALVLRRKKKQNQE